MSAVESQLVTHWKLPSRNGLGTETNASAGRLRGARRGQPSPSQRGCRPGLACYKMIFTSGHVLGKRGRGLPLLNVFNLLHAYLARHTRTDPVLQLEVALLEAPVEQRDKSRRTGR